MTITIDDDSDHGDDGDDDDDDDDDDANGNDYDTSLIAQTMHAPYIIYIDSLIHTVV